MKSIARTAASTAAIFALLASSASAGLIIDGTFSGSGFASGSVSTLSGSFSAYLDDSMYTGVGSENLEDLAILTAFTLNPNPLGVTTFDTSNVGVDLGLSNGAITFLYVGGLPNVSAIGSGDDDFIVAFSSTGAATDMSYSIANESGIPGTTDVSGSFSSRETSVPVPTTIALLALGLAGFAYRQRKAA